MNAVILSALLLTVCGLAAGVELTVEHIREKLSSFQIPQSVHEDRAKFLKDWSEIVKAARIKAASSPVDDKPRPKIEDPTSIPWECPYFPPSATVPTSVHALRPADIDIVAAFGDSITAGNGVRAEMERPWMTAIPNRGEAFSVGGERSLDEGSMTITNILRKYNPEVEGASYCARTRFHPWSGYNVAVPGDKARGMESQAVELINKLLERLTIEEYFSTWKMVTLLIGGNDLCQFCIPTPNQNDSTAEGYTNGIKRALDVMHEYLPRAFVNLQIMTDVTPVKDLIHPGQEEFCEELHNIECACAMNPETAPQLRPLQLAYYDLLMELVADDRYDTRDDFTVVIQPFLKDQLPFTLPDGSYDMSYFAPDCFHPGVKTHQAFAIGLWNCMLTPVGQKPFLVDESEPQVYKCPSESEPYFYTTKNSGLKQK